MQMRARKFWDTPTLTNDTPTFRARREPAVARVELLTCHNKL